MDIAQVLSGRLLTKHEVKQQLNQAGKLDLLDVVLQQSVQHEAVTFHNNTVMCGRCNNTESTRFSEVPHSKGYYCLNCLNLGRIVQGEQLYSFEIPVEMPVAEPVLTWEGTLSPEQSRASQDLIASLMDTRPHLVYAVTGAGKTEMIFSVIERVLLTGGRVCVATPRIDVCLELFPRLQAAFAQTDCLLLYGGATEMYRYTPLVVATTHQLLRFSNAFDLLIVDEVDAFPYVNDHSLHFAVKRAVRRERGNLVFLTATPDETLSKQIATGQITTTILPARYHGFALPLPQFVWCDNWRIAISKQRRSARLFKLLRTFLQGEGVKLIFMPNIALAEKLFQLLSKWFPEYRLACVHAKDPARKEKILALRQGDLEGIISTTILERGVTFTNCQVCVIGAEDTTYTESVLVQISGRVGRKVEFPTGRLWFAHYGVSRAMKRAKQQIQQMNRRARERGLIR